MFLVPLIKSLAESPEHLPLEWPLLVAPTPSFFTDKLILILQTLMEMPSAQTEIFLSQLHSLRSLSLPHMTLHL